MLRSLQLKRIEIGGMSTEIFSGGPVGGVWGGPSTYFIRPNADKKLIQWTGPLSPKTLDWQAPHLFQDLNPPRILVSYACQTFPTI